MTENPHLSDEYRIAMLEARVKELEYDREYYVDACVIMAWWIHNLTRGRKTGDEVITEVKEAIENKRKHERVQEYFEVRKNVQHE
jgi:hypothetical protein